jgi:electron transfer flavoprotein alpha subunit
MLAVIVVRDGLLPAGADETISECDGRAMLVGSGTPIAVEKLRHVASDVTTVEVGDFRPTAWAQALTARLVDEPIVVLPASPDGRDWAPHLALQLRRPLLAMAMTVNPDRVDLIRRGGTELHAIEPPPAFVATLQPGVRGVDAIGPAMVVDVVDLDIDESFDATIEMVTPADAATIDLSEAQRIVAGGAGLDSPARFEELSALGAALHASVGATRVITDRGWIAHQRQIGTTGVIVDPRLYLAFGISGAVQHTAGLGSPDHIISVNTDPHCPMMQLADLAIVADANEVLAELLNRIGARP